MDNKDYRIGPPLTLQISADLAEKGMNDRHQDICLNSLLLDALHNSRYDQECLELQQAHRTVCKMASEFQAMEMAMRASDATSQQFPISPPGGSQRSSSAFFGLSSHESPVLASSYSAIVKWLKDNYEEVEGISLPRSAIYRHYLSSYPAANTNNTSAASFGKVIKLVFPNIKKRRLGNRGQSKYHYYGLSVKQSSCNNKDVLRTQRVNNFSPYQEKTCRSRTMFQSALLRGAGYDSRVNMLQAGSFLPDFPTLSSLAIPQGIRESMSVFLLMYKQHNQRLLETLARENFQKVKESVEQFWRMLPCHIAGMFHEPAAVNLVALCDTMLYRAVCNLLIPNLLHPLPLPLSRSIRTLAKDIISSQQEALKHLPSLLRNIKIQVAKSYSRCLRCLTEVSHVSCTTRSMLSCSDMVQSMYSDWQQLDADYLIKQCLSLMSGNVDRDARKLNKYFLQFSKLLEQQSSLERFLNWIRTIVEHSVMKLVEKHGCDFKKVAADFLLKWSYVSETVMKEITLENAESFGCYHLLSMMFQTYATHLVEQYARNMAEKHLRHLVYARYTSRPPACRQLRFGPYLKREAGVSVQSSTSNSSCDSNSSAGSSSSSSRGGNVIASSSSLTELLEFNWCTPFFPEEDPDVSSISSPSPSSSSSLYSPSLSCSTVHSQEDSGLPSFPFSASASCNAIRSQEVTDLHSSISSLSSSCNAIHSQDVTDHPSSPSSPLISCSAVHSQEDSGLPSSPFSASASCNVIHSQEVTDHHSSPSSPSLSCSAVHSWDVRNQHTDNCSEEQPMDTWEVI